MDLICGQRVSLRGLTVKLRCALNRNVYRLTCNVACLLTCNVEMSTDLRAPCGHTAAKNARLLTPSLACLLALLAPSTRHVPCTRRAAHLICVFACLLACCAEPVDTPRACPARGASRGATRCSFNICSACLLACLYVCWTVDTPRAPCTWRVAGRDALLIELLFCLSACMPLCVLDR